MSSDTKDQVRLSGFLSRFAKVALGFAFVESALTLWLGDTRVACACAVTGTFGVVGLFAQRSADAGHVPRAALTAGFAVLVAALLHVVVVPQAFPALVLIPVVAVGVALPYVKGPSMRALFACGWLASVGIAVAGLALPKPALHPPWFGNVLAVAGIGAVAFLIAHLQADFVARTREQQRAIERQNATLTFLAESSAVFAESLDVNATLLQSARIAVPFLCDWCCIDMVDESGAIRRVASKHGDPSKDELLRILETRYPLRLGSPQPAAVAMETGKPFLASSVNEADIDRFAVDAENARLIAALGTRSVLAVPISRDGAAAGALTFGAARKGRFNATDLPLMQELARRIGLALTNAHVHEMTRKAVQVRDDFLSIAGHELRTPLTALKLQLEGLLRRAGAEGTNLGFPLVERLEKSAKQVNRLDSLVEQLLDVTQISAGKLELTRASMDLAELVREVVDRFADVAERARTPLVAEANVVTIGHWDRARLDQAITNLVGNALKYGAERPVRVAIESDDVLARITVEDCGIGIAPDALGRIFGRFERAVSQRHYGGFGLGLWIVRNIVEAHGGVASVISEPNVRTVFRIDLPRATAPAPS